MQVVKSLHSSIRQALTLRTLSTASEDMFVPDEAIFASLFQLVDFIEQQSSLIPDVIQVLVETIGYPNPDIGIKGLEMLVEMVTQENQQEFIVNLSKIESFGENAVNLADKLNEDKPAQSNTVYSILSLLEKQINYGHQLNTIRILPFLVKRIKAYRYDQNQQYAVQIIQLLVAGNLKNSLLLIECKGVQIMLEYLFDSLSRKKPVTQEHHETLELILQVLTILPIYPETLKQLINLQASSLLLKLVKSKGVIALSALYVLDCLLKEAPEQAKVMVDQSILGIICPILMQKGLRQKDPQLEMRHWEAVTGIIASIIMYSYGTYRKRVVDKILEKDFQKLKRLRELAEKYADQQEFDRQPQKQEDYLKMQQNGRIVIQNFAVIVLGLAGQKRLPFDWKNLSKACRDWLMTKAKFSNEIPSKRAVVSIIEKSIS